MPTLVARGSITIIDVMDGANGSAVSVSPSRALSFTATDGALDAGQSNITFTATTSGLSNPTFVWTFSGFETAPSNSGTSALTVTAAQFGTSKSATVTCTVNGSYSATATIVRLEKSSAAAGATVGAPAGTTVGGTAAETVASRAAGALQKAGDDITGRINLQVADGLFAGTDLNNGVYLGSNGLVGKKAGATTFALGTDGALRMSGQLMLGSFSGYSWPTAGQSGAYLGPEGLMLGNQTDGKYLQVTAGGDMFAPGFKVEGGVLTISQANVISTLQIASQAVTVPVAAEGGTTGWLNQSQQFLTSPYGDFAGQPVLVIVYASYETPSADYGLITLGVRRDGTQIRSFPGTPSTGGVDGASRGFVCAAFVDYPATGQRRYSLGLSGFYTLKVLSSTITMIGLKR